MDTYIETLDELYKTKSIIGIDTIQDIIKDINNSTLVYIILGDGYRKLCNKELNDEVDDDRIKMFFMHNILDVDIFDVGEYIDSLMVSNEPLSSNQSRGIIYNLDALIKCTDARKLYLILAYISYDFMRNNSILKIKDIVDPNKARTDILTRKILVK